MYYKIKRFLKNANCNRLLLITAAVVVILTAAVGFIYLYGKNETISIQTSSKMNDTEVYGSSEKPRSGDMVYVDVSGCVKSPGVYQMPYGSRIFEVIEKAGGLTKHADTALINQAEMLTDGAKINIPDKRDTEKKSVAAAPSKSDGAASVGLININTADSEELQKITGIGPATAEKIIRYREENGAFSSVDELTNVSGIGEKTLEKMRPQVTV